MEKKFHYFAFAFRHGDDSCTTHASVYVGYDDKLITVPRIEAAKEHARIKQDAVLMSVCYMGHMTKEQCENYA